MTASQFTHAELRAALTFMLAGPVQSGNVDAAADTSLAIVSLALANHSMRLKQQGFPIGARLVADLAEALGEPPTVEQDGAGE